MAVVTVHTEPVIPVPPKISSITLELNEHEAFYMLGCLGLGNERGAAGPDVNIYHRLSGALRDTAGHDGFDLAYIHDDPRYLASQRWLIDNVKRNY